MKFTFLRNRFRSDDMILWSKNGVFIEIDKKIMKFPNWEDLREMMYKLEEIAPEAVLYNKRRRYGKDLVVYPDEGKWVLWWKGRFLEMDREVLKVFPVVLRYFIRRYHKLMLDYNAFKLHEGFEIETNNASYKKTRSSGTIST